MSNGLTRPVRGGIPIAIAFMILGGVAIQTMAPGGYQALPIVRHFHSWSDFAVGVGFATVLILAVATLAFRRTRRSPPVSVVTGHARFKWTPLKFASALVLTPSVILFGAWFIRGFDGILVGPYWHSAFHGLAWLNGGFWLASAFHAFRHRWKTVLWLLAGVGIALSVRVARISEITLGDTFGAYANSCMFGGSEYLLCSKTRVRLPGLDYLMTIRLGRVRRRHLDLTWYETLAETQTAITDVGVYPEHGCLVRPEGFPGGRGWFLYASNDGFLADVGPYMQCDLAYDTVTGEAFGEWHAPDRHDRNLEPDSYLRKGMGSLSPFRLVEAGGRPDPSDVGLLEDAAAMREKKLQPGQPSTWCDTIEGLGWAASEKALLPALLSRNEHVRAAASRVVRAGGKAVYPRAFEMVR